MSKRKVVEDVFIKSIYSDENLKAIGLYEEYLTREQKIELYPKVQEKVKSLRELCARKLNKVIELAKEEPEFVEEKHKGVQKIKDKYICKPNFNGNFDGKITCINIPNNKKIKECDIKFECIDQPSLSFHIFALQIGEEFSPIRLRYNQDYASFGGGIPYYAEVYIVKKTGNRQYLQKLCAEFNEKGDIVNVKSSRSKSFFIKSPPRVLVNRMCKIPGDLLGMLRKDKAESDIAR